MAVLGENFEVYDHSERKVISELHKTGRSRRLARDHGRRSQRQWHEVLGRS
jgi:hypothetical protein